MTAAVEAKPNLDRIRLVLEHIDAEPERFDMNNYMRVDLDDDDNDNLEEGPYACGTTMCVAGWANHLSGRFTWNPQLLDLVHPNGGMIYHDREAAAWLGLLREQIRPIFHAYDCNTPALIRERIEEVLGVKL